MNILCLLAASVTVLIVTGCAHPITVAPNLATLDRSKTTSVRIAANAGYYIPVTACTMEVTTPGGGGDNVRYFPYRDIEAGFQKVLSNVFSNAVKIATIADAWDGKRDAIDYVLVPEIVTTSGGSGFFTWPPTSFTVDLTSSVRDRDGKLLTTVRVVGAGSAKTSERLPEHGIAGRRAMEDALLKMQRALLESKVFNAKAGVHPKNQADAGSVSSRLAELKTLKDNGQIIQEEYEAKRKVILDSL